MSAKSPNGRPEQAGTIKAAVGVNARLFHRQLQLIEERRSSWLAQAVEATPELHSTEIKPIAVVQSKKDSASFQGWKMIEVADPASVLNRPLVPGDSFILDFGGHVTGHFTFYLRRFDIPVDAPVRLSFIFGEVPAEVTEPMDPYTGTLTRSWLQDEVMNFDEVPQTVTLPRRYAFRYVKVTVVSASEHGKFGFSDMGAASIIFYSADKGYYRGGNLHHRLASRLG